MESETTNIIHLPRRSDPVPLRSSPDKLAEEQEVIARQRQVRAPQSGIFSRGDRGGAPGPEHQRGSRPLSEHD